MKILIFEKISSLQNTGGPSGYLYNISEYLKLHPQSEIHFLREDGVKERLLSRICTFILMALVSLTKRSMLQHIPLVISNFMYGRKLTDDSIAYLNQFDAIHVHAGPIMYQFFKRNKVKGKLILTSHCPEPVIDEMSGKPRARDFYNRHSKLRNWILKQEVKVYDICDYIIFPVPQAREPYENASPIYKEKFIDVNHKFFYVPTALNSTAMIPENNHVLDQFDIKKDKLCLCYIGRHTEVKGYYFLKETAKKCLDLLPDTRFVIGGMKDCKIGLDDTRWIELGWVNTPTLLNEVDAFILPNKETYFDLILLEVLRQGTPVLISRTGGNKWYESYNVAGIKFFDYGNTDELIEKIREIKTLKENGELADVKETNRIFFRKTFGMKKYIENYLYCIRKILA